MVDCRFPLSQNFSVVQFLLGTPRTLGVPMLGLQNLALTRMTLEIFQEEEKVEMSR